MKILHLSATDIIGGAARAAYRLHAGLKLIGQDSAMLVQEKRSFNANILSPRTRLSQGAAMARATLDALPLTLYGKAGDSNLSLQWVPERVLTRCRLLAPDIVHLHWINRGFMRIETLAKLHVPTVWTLHDMWPFTGGCHYSGSCARYTSGCGACPLLNSHRTWDLTRWVHQRKVKALNLSSLCIVATSSWLAQRARESSLLSKAHIEIIPYGLDTEIFRPLDRVVARDLLRLPKDKKLVLFGGTSNLEPRKGFSFLKSALQSLCCSTSWKDRIELVTFGPGTTELKSELGVKCHSLGYLADDLSLAMAYSAADVVVVPSLQEAFGQVASEALACGTPVVAFQGTGVTDIVDHRQNGYLAAHADASDLAQGITWVLEDEGRYKELAVMARQKAIREYTLELQAQRYLHVYERLLGYSGQARPGPS